MIGGNAIMCGGDHHAERAGSLIARLIQERRDLGYHLLHCFGTCKRGGLRIRQRMFGFTLEPVAKRLKKIAIGANEQVARADRGNRSRKIDITPRRERAGLMAQAMERGVVAPEDVGLAGAGRVIAVEPGIDRFGRGIKAGLEKSRYGRIGGRIFKICLKIRQRNGAGKCGHLLGKG